MKFSYYKVFLQEPCPVDGKCELYRPMLPVEISVGDQWVWVDALIDSGADYNMAPKSIGEDFGINFSMHPTLDVMGIDQQSVKCYMVPVSLKIGGHFFQSTVAFGEDIPEILLGQKGFFDKLKNVNFTYPDFVEIQQK